MILNIKVEPNTVNIYLKMKQKKEEYKSNDGTLLLTASFTVPVVLVPCNREAAAAINRYVENYSIAGLSAYEVIRLAEEDYKARGKANWHRGYETDLSFAPKRLDSSVISFRADAFSDTGGAHPDSAAAGLTFSTKTGRRLTLGDITGDERAAWNKIAEYILVEIKRMEAENEGMFFEDYEEHIRDILTEDTWYLAEDGMHIIGNEYIISPHVAGILDFAIPYDKAGFLKEEYR